MIGLHEIFISTSNSGVKSRVIIPVDRQYTSLFLGWNPRNFHVFSWEDCRTLWVGDVEGWMARSPWNFAKNCWFFDVIFLLSHKISMISYATQVDISMIHYEHLLGYIYTYIYVCIYMLYVYIYVICILFLKHTLLVNLLRFIPGPKSYGEICHFSYYTSDHYTISPLYPW